MPYGVRAMMNGTSPLAFFGVKIVVCNRTPSRIGIITSLESNAGAAVGTWPTAACATSTNASNGSSSARSFMRCLLPNLPPQEIFHAAVEVEPTFVNEGFVCVVGNDDQLVLDFVCA